MLDGWRRRAREKTAGQRDKGRDLPIRTARRWGRRTRRLGGLPHRGREAVPGVARHAETGKLIGRWLIGLMVVVGMEASPREGGERFDVLRFDALSPLHSNRTPNHHHHVLQLAPPAPRSLYRGPLRPWRPPRPRANCCHRDVRPSHYLPPYPALPTRHGHLGRRSLGRYPALPRQGLRRGRPSCSGTGSRSL